MSRFWVSEKESTETIKKFQKIFFYICCRLTDFIAHSFEKLCEIRWWCRCFTSVDSIQSNQEDDKSYLQSWKSHNYEWIRRAFGLFIQRSMPSVSITYSKINKSIVFFFFFFFLSLSYDGWIITNQWIRSCNAMYRERERETEVINIFEQIVFDKEQRIEILLQHLVCSIQLISWSIPSSIWVKNELRHSMSAWFWVFNRRDLQLKKKAK